MSFLTSLLGPFRTPSADEQIVRELETAKRSLLEAKTAQEYANALVRYNVDRVVRLQRLVAQIGNLVDPTEFIPDYQNSRTADNAPAADYRRPPVTVRRPTEVPSPKINSGNFSPFEDVNLEKRA